MTTTEIVYDVEVLGHTNRTIAVAASSEADAMEKAEVLFKAEHPEAIGVEAISIAEADGFDKGRCDHCGNPADPSTQRGPTRRHPSCDDEVRASNAEILGYTAPTTEISIRSAADAVADIFSQGADLQLAASLSCAEANAIASLFRAIGRVDDAAAFTAAHAVEDEEGEEHYLGEPEDDEDAAGPVGGHCSYCDADVAVEISRGERVCAICGTPLTED